jgi:hypothetical protein
MAGNSKGQASFPPLSDKRNRIRKDFNKAAASVKYMMNFLRVLWEDGTGFRSF